MKRVPAECFPPAAYIEDELAARGKDLVWLLAEVGGTKRAVLGVTRGEAVTNRAAEALADVFGTSKSLWLNLDAAWWDWLEHRMPQEEGR